MRTIKFRAKRKDNEKWVCGSLVKTPFGVYIEWYEDSICNRVEIDPTSVCQFTGLLDSTGREIYEGETLSFPSTQHIVDGIPVRKLCYIRVVFDQGAFCAFDEIEQRISRPLGSYDKTVTSVWKIVG